MSLTMVSLVFRSGLLRAPDPRGRSLEAASALRAPLQHPREGTVRSGLVGSDSSSTSRPPKRPRGSTRATGRPASHVSSVHLTCSSHHCVPRLLTLRLSAPEPKLGPRQPCAAHRGSTRCRRPFSVRRGRALPAARTEVLAAAAPCRMSTRSVRPASPAAGPCKRSAAWAAFVARLAIRGWVAVRRGEGPGLELRKARGRALSGGCLRAMAGRGRALALSHPPSSPALAVPRPPERSAAAACAARTVPALPRSRGSVAAVGTSNVAGFLTLPPAATLGGRLRGRVVGQAA
jgi:hypothetical protein